LIVGTFADFPESMPTMAESLPTIAGMRSHQPKGGIGIPTGGIAGFGLANKHALKVHQCQTWVNMLDAGRV